MTDLQTYLDQRWSRLSEKTIRILDLRNPEVLLKIKLLWSLQWVRDKETELSGVNYSP